MITTYIQNNVAESTLTIDSIGVVDTGTYVCTSTDKTNAKFRVQLNDYNTMMSQDQPREEQRYKMTTAPPLKTVILEQGKTTTTGNYS